MEIQGRPGRGCTAPDSGLMIYDQQHRASVYILLALLSVDFDTESACAGNGEG